MWTFEPHVAEAVFRGHARRGQGAGDLGQRLDLQRAYRKQGPRIAAMAMESGRVFAGRMFIDATYEGDLMAKAGVSYTVGREANAKYGETLNGVQAQPGDHAPVHPAASIPTSKPGDPGQRPAAGRPRRRARPTGRGDRRVQAYNFRMCLTDVPANRLPVPKPAGYYDPLRYELLLRNFEAGDQRCRGTTRPMPNRKTDTNNNCARSRPTTSA